MTDLPTPPPTTTEVPQDASAIPDDPGAPPVLPGAYLLELIPMPVTDIDRAKRFYAEQCGFHVDVDVAPADGVRIVQLTPPGSFCSISLLQGMPQVEMEPGSLRGLHLVVKDIEAARQELVGRGVEVSEVEDLGGVFYAWFADPDGNTWALQHMPWRK
ncbi:VOC family protein [Kribbella sp. NPDC048915]|uniref:VOC family protein n=1 Tax=Kribbella sp. NPDC048915 TaxID=3155148 RepID=UPI003409BBD5